MFEEEVNKWKKESTDRYRRQLEQLNGADWQLVKYYVTGIYEKLALLENKSTNHFCFHEISEANQRIIYNDIQHRQFKCADFDHLFQRKEHVIAFYEAAKVDLPIDINR